MLEIQEQKHQTQTLTPTRTALELPIGQKPHQLDQIDVVKIVIRVHGDQFPAGLLHQFRQPCEQLAE